MLNQQQSIDQQYENAVEAKIYFYYFISHCWICHLTLLSTNYWYCYKLPGFPWGPAGPIGPIGPEKNYKSEKFKT